jgi:hypothetical protein
MAADERQELLELRRLAELEARAQPKASMGVQLGVGLPEAAMQMASATVAEPLAGLAGIGAAIMPGGKSGGQMVRDVRQSLTYQPRSPEGQAMLPNAVQSVADATPGAIKQPVMGAAENYDDLKNWVADNYGPEAAAAVATLPTAILEAIPAGLAIRQTRRAGRPAPDQFAPEEPPELRSVTPGESTPVESIVPRETTPTQEQYQGIADQMRTGKAEQVAPAVAPDVQIMKDAEALGIDLNPSHYSTNRAYMDLEQSLKSRPGSLLASQEEKAILELGNRADDLIEKFSGSLDKSALDEGLRTEFSATINGLEQQSNALYDKIDARIPRATRVDAERTRAFLDQQLADLGGNETLLTSAEKELRRLIGGESPPTYAALDRVRKDIGRAIGKKEGAFKEDDTGKLQQIYAVLSEDQTDFADAFGVGDIYRDAKDLVRQRKRVEDQAITMFGRELSGSIIPKLRQAGSNLTRGDISKLNQMMESVPEGRRAEVAATLLNDLFSLGARRNAPIGQGFVNAFAALNRNAGAKNALFSYLPDEAKERFDMIGRVATGIYRSKALENNSKTARDVIAAMDDGGMLSKLYGLGKQAAMAEGISTSIGVPGAGLAGVVGSALVKGKAPATQAADALLTSQKFRDAVSAYAVGSKVSDNVLKNTPEYDAWLKTQSEGIKAEIAAIGFIPWLTGNAGTEK